MNHPSSKPRKVAITFDDGSTREAESVSEAARLLGIGREHLHAHLSGRTGKRAPYSAKYA